MKQVTLSAKPNLKKLIRLSVDTYYDTKKSYVILEGKNAL